MADTAHKKDSQKIQYFDSEKQLDEKVDTLANLIIKSKHFIAFTGAGISTSCGIPDFRSGVNTVLKTGPGVWQKQAQKIPNNSTKTVVPMSKAVPSFTHMALVQLQKQGYLKYLVSQNIDGLHLRSGFDPKKLAQLHGNRCLEKCKKCKSEFLRDFGVRQAKKSLQHETSRKCEKCGGKLYDSIINFGETLPQYQINRSYEQGQKADLCLALGSSLTVTPAANIPQTVGKKQKLIIVNLQKTPLDKVAFMRINGMCDNVMKKLTQRLQLKVRDFTFERLIKFNINKSQDMQFRGVDSRGIPYSIFKEVDIAYDNQKTYKKLKGQLFTFSLKKKSKGKLKFEFYGYYGEPNYQLILNKQRSGTFKMIYNPRQRKWTECYWIDEKEQNIKQQIKQQKKENSQEIQDRQQQQQKQKIQLNQQTQSIY